MNINFLDATRKSNQAKFNEVAKNTPVRTFELEELKGVAILTANKMRAGGVENIEQLSKGGALLIKALMLQGFKEHKIATFIQLSRLFMKNRSLGV